MPMIALALLKIFARSMTIEMATPASVERKKARKVPAVWL